MRTLFFILILTFGNAWAFQSQTQGVKHVDGSSMSIPIGTEKTPIYVNGEVTLKKDKEEIKEEVNERSIKDKNDAALVKYTLWLAIFTGLLFLFTFGLFWVTWKLSRDSEIAGQRQGSEMADSIKQATRAATAMELIAEATKNNASLMQNTLQKQMRAYLAFDSAVEVPQDITTGWKYEMRFFIKNYGHTNAKSINVSSALMIADYPLSESFDLTLDTNEIHSAAEISPGQSFFYRACLDRILSENEVLEMKKQTSRAMYLYGTIKYKDVFGEWHFTNFCKICGWDVKNLLIVTNIFRHNDTD